MMSEGTAGMTKKVHKPCPIQQFFEDAGFSTSVVRRKTVVQPGSLGEVVSPPQRGPGVTPQKILILLHSK